MKWIPVSERLPKAEEKVWIQTERGKVCFAMYEDGTISEDDSTWHWYDLPFDKWDEENDCGIIPEGWWEWTEFHPNDEFDCPVDEVVIAWMPIPPPYKAEQTEPSEFCRYCDNYAGDGMYCAENKIVDDDTQACDKYKPTEPTTEDCSTVTDCPWK